MKAIKPHASASPTATTRRTGRTAPAPPLGGGPARTAHPAPDRGLTFTRHPTEDARGG